MPGCLAFVILVLLWQTQDGPVIILGTFFLSLTYEVARRALSQHVASTRIPDRLPRDIVERR